MAQDVERHVQHVLGEHVVATADEGQGARGEDEVDRGPRAGAEGDVALQLAEPVGLRVPASPWPGVTAYSKSAGST